MHNNNRRLWYRKPAGEWKEGLPIGTGRLAGMVLGTPEKERVALNHEWLSSGWHRHRENEERSQYLPEVRRLLQEEKYDEASVLANEAWGGNGGISGRPTQEDAYKPLGDFYFTLAHGEVCNYFRELNLDEDIIRISYEADGKCFRRSYMAQLVRDCLIIELEAGGESFDGTFWMGRQQEENVMIRQTALAESRQILLEGEFTGGGLHFAAQADFCVEGGTVTTTPEQHLHIEGATKITIFINMGTDVKEGISALEECRMRPLPEEDFHALYLENVKEYQEHYGRLCLEIEAEADNPCEALPTDERIQAYREGSDDATMPLLYFNYGRYLLCASSANGELPANLQGKWNEDLYPAWDCDYHNDINIQMNYWPAESGHLQEYMEAFFTYLEKMVPYGREAARRLFGCRGIWLPLSSDNWGCATPETYGWSVWCSVAAWFGQHVWWHYEYSQDRKFLEQRGYPYLKEVAAFYEDFLVKDEEGIYQIMPSQSPENHFEGGGEMPVTICTSSAVDVEFAAELLTHTIQAAEILQADPDKVIRWKEIRDHLPELKIGSKGQLLEWNQEFEETEPWHRHVSHLIGLYPGEQIHPDRTPELYRAARKSLELRLQAGGGYTGWSRAWTACLYARLGEGNLAWEHLRALIGDYATESLLDLHPPRIFQIDGNLGGTAAMLEMLLQSYYGELDFLPALPDKWKTGRITGLRARGGYTVDMSWKDGRLEQARLVSLTDRECRLRDRGMTFCVKENGQSIALRREENCLVFRVSRGKEYFLELSAGSREAVE